MIRRSAALPERLDALRNAIALAESRLDADTVQLGRFVADKADARLIHGTEHTVAALAGATGSGKSSIFNALCAEQISVTSVQRPTTGEGHAAVFGAADASPLLDWLEVFRRHRVRTHPEALDGLVLIDLPDHDSVRVANRLEMERLVELVDLLIWVTDPEKYADAALHSYLRALAGFDETTIVALNKADLLSQPQVKACVSDLGRLLNDDGLSKTRVVVVSATTGEGVGDLSDALGSAVISRKAAVGRLSNEVADAAKRMREAVGSGEPREISSSQKRHCTEALAEATGIPAVTDAVAAGYRRDAAEAAGWPFTRWTRRFRPHPLRRLHLASGSAGRTTVESGGNVAKANMMAALRATADDATKGMEAPWPQRARNALAEHDDDLADELDQAVRKAEPGNWKDPIWWKTLGLAQIVAAISVVGGLIWLAVLFGFSYLRLPEPPTPEWEGWEAPTLMIFGGFVVGLVLTLLVRVLASFGAKRRAHKARKAMLGEVEEVVENRVMEPLRAELGVVTELQDLLDTAAGN